eukprot:1179296-Prorocentrum_minimum.AAC.2
MAVLCASILVYFVTLKTLTLNPKTQTTSPTPPNMFLDVGRRTRVVSVSPAELRYHRSFLSKGSPCALRTARRLISRGTTSPGLNATLLLPTALSWSGARVRYNCEGDAHRSLDTYQQCKTP